MDIEEQVLREITRVGSDVAAKHRSFDHDLADARQLALTVKTHADQELNRFGEGVKTAISDLRKDVDAVTTVLNRTGRSIASEQSGIDSPEVKAFRSYLRVGPEAMDSFERKMLATAPDTSGGFLVPSTVNSDVQRLILEFSPIRQLARVISIGTGTLDLPKVGSGPSATWVGEVETRPATDSSFKNQSIDLEELATYIDASQRLLEDASFPVEQLISEMLADAFNLAEASAVLVGNGIKKPLGILNTPQMPTVPSGNATDIRADSLFDAYYSLKQPFWGNASWLMNRKTAATIRKMKDGQGRYLWDEVPSGLTNGMASTLLGRPVYLCPDMPDVAANATPILIGDFKRGLTMINKGGAGGISILRDPFSLATTGQVRLHARMRTGAAVNRSEAFNLIKVAVS